MAESILRPMAPTDFAAGVALCRMAGWNQREADWRLFHGCNPAGCFVVESEGRVVGTVTSIDYDGRCSWVGMVLVDPCMRRQGVGTRLLKTAIDALSGCACVKLDATPAGKQLYDTLGFVDEYRLARLILPAAPVLPPVSGVRPMREADLDQVVELDTAAFGVARARVIRGIYRMAPELACVAGDDTGIDGFLLGRPGENFTLLGPVQADCVATAQALMQTALSRLTGQAIGTDILLHTPAWQAWLTGIGFAEQRQFIRMVKGTNLPGDPARQYSITGPELG